jgi:hypothetical protein
MGMAVTEQERAKAFALFAEGESTNAVAKALFKKDWARANKLRVEYDARDGGASAETVETLEADEEEPAAWDLTVQLSVEQMDRFIASFTPQEKADAITTALQARLDAVEA